MSEKGKAGRYRVRQGGLMRCCLASLYAAVEADPSLAQGPEGATVTCRYCQDELVFRTDAWEWGKAEEVGRWL